MGQIEGTEMTTIAAPETEAAAAEPAPPAADEPKLGARQRERIERLMAAVKAELGAMFETEKAKGGEA